MALMRWTGTFAIVALAACGNDGGSLGGGKSVGKVVAEAKLEIPAMQAAMVTLGEGPRRTTVEVPPQAVAQRGPVTVQVVEPVARRGAMPVNGTAVNVATQAVTFSPAARMRQMVPPPPPGRTYVAVYAQPNVDVWAQRGPARPVSQSAGEMQEFEIDVAGTGLWAIATVDPIDGGVPGDGSTGDGSAGDGARGDVVPGDGGMSYAPGPPLARLEPPSGAPNLEVALLLAGSEIPREAVAVFDGEKLTTRYLSVNAVEATVPARLTAQAGQHTVWIEVARAGGVTARSNTLYFTVTPAAGAPVIVDYNPDNALPGEKVQLVGRDLAGENARITDSRGTMAAPGAQGTVTWWGGQMATLEFTLPEGWQTGPITLTHAKGSYRGKVFTVGRNLTRLTGAMVQASTEYGGVWTTPKGADNNLFTSWFSANYDCATAMSCKSIPWYKLTFPAPQTIARIAIRGNREYESGYDFVRGKFEILAADGGVLWGASYDLPQPDRDLDIVLTMPVANATTVKFTSEVDESIEPGFAELEVFGP